ncbi:hypothetical protein [Okeania sp. SIO3B5]|nr:hypothetical protein [Okeania sp. SIO3B5]
MAGSWVISCLVEYLHFGGRKAEGSGSWRQKAEGRREEAEKVFFKE